MTTGADAEATRSALAAVTDAPTLLGALRLGADLDRAASADGEASLAPLEAAAADPDDQLTAAVAVLALGSVGTERSGLVLTGLLEHGPARLRDEAAWALGRGPLVAAALPPLASAVATGGFRGMLAQRTLQSWAVRHPDAVGSALEVALLDCVAPVGRAALVETLGLVPGAATAHSLRQVALDPTEAATARAAAVAALGDRRSDPADLDETRQVLMRLADTTGPLASVAALSLSDLAEDESPAEPVELAESAERVRSTGRAAGADGGATNPLFTVGQLFLHADIDGDLSHAGQGDTGGIATLLVQLGDALLAASPSVGRVLTISRGLPTDAVEGLVTVAGPGHHYLSVPLWGPNVPSARAWPLRVAVARGIRRILRAAGRVDVVHLRMGDVATMVTAAAAADLGIPVVFTLAPDPNALVASRDVAGTLTRANFGAADAVEHLVFRERLLRDLQVGAAHLVLFPRPALADDMRALMDLDVVAEAERVTVVAEGVSIAAIESAAAQGDSPGSASARALVELDHLLGGLPPHRRHLPLAISVGRLNRVKGMATLVESWADDGGLRDRCNLLVVGGDLVSPTDDEREQLDAIERVVPHRDAAARGLLLPGHRANATVVAWLGAVLHGRPGLAGPRGVYVSASLKEEFGIAILEAMATGLVVVAPDAGGPATYVVDGVTGILTETANGEKLAAAVHSALDLAVADGADDRAEQARQLVRDRFGIDTMATALAEVYHRVAGARHPEGVHGDDREVATS